MAKNDPHLDLTIQSTSGSFTDRWNRNNKAQKVYDDALAHFGLSAGEYYLKRERDGATLNLAEKLDDLGILDGDLLILQAAQPKDG
jgi:hypothetical protein